MGAVRNKCKELPKSSFENYTARSLVNTMKAENYPALKN